MCRLPEACRGSIHGTHTQLRVRLCSGGSLSAVNQVLVESLKALLSYLAHLRLDRIKSL